MKTALLVGGFGVALAMLAPTVRALLGRQNSAISDEEYFAAARRRAIGYRLAKRSTPAQGDE